MEKHRCLCSSLLSIGKNYINLPYTESGLPVMLLAEGSPCPHLNPRAFFIVFSSPVPLRMERERECCGGAELPTGGKPVSENLHE